MVVPDPAADLLSAVTRAGDEPELSDRRVVALAQRRFGIAVSPPFARPLGSASRAPEIPVRVATGLDGPAIAAVKWRSYRTAYRGVLPDPFLDDLGIHPPAGYWTGRAAVPPSARHSLLVAGGRGEVHGFCDAGPARDDDLDPQRTAEIAVLYVDPSAIGLGVGRRLVQATCDRLVDAGFDDARLWVLRANAGARRFYERLGWRPDGAEKSRRLEAEDVTFDEVRYRPGRPAGLRRG